jgi:predicted peptidase
MIPTRYPYDRVLPPTYEQTSKPFPLLLFLHGSGERGDDRRLVHRHGPPSLAHGPVRPAFLDPFILLSPQCPAGEDWSVPALLAWLDTVLPTLRVALDQVYLTGISLGGRGAWRLAQAAPQRFAALCPICGGGDPARAAVLRDLPIWMFHSAADQAVPVAESDAMFSALQACNATVTYTRYRALDHVQTWQDAYQQAGLYAWLRRHTRSPQATP